MERGLLVAAVAAASFLMVASFGLSAGRLRAAESFEGIWAETKKECLDDEGPKSRTLIDLGNVVRGKPTPIFDQYENHCRIERKSTFGDITTLDVICFEFWENFAKGIDGRKTIIKLSSRKGGLEIDGKIYGRCEAKGAPTQQREGVTLSKTAGPQVPQVGEVAEDPSDANTYLSANYMLLAAVLLVVVAGIYFLLSRPRQTDHRNGAVIMSRSGKVPDPPEKPHQFGDVWYYADHTGHIGPFSFKELKARLAEIPGANNLLVWCDGMSQWQKVVAIPELNERIKPPPPPNVKPPRDYSEIGLFIRRFLIFVIIMVVIAAIGKANQPPNPEDVACSLDYRKCHDNSHMINTYSHMFIAKTRCQTELSKSVRYGSPEWGWVPFGYFYNGEDYIRTGIVRITDEEVKIQNMFGAKVNSVVECHYDFNNESARIVSTSER
jgi:hypothetical protein